MPNLITLAQSPFLISLILAWSFFWKGLALWQAASRRHLTWFIIILLVNTLGLLEIGYVFYLHRFDLGSQTLLKKLSRFQSKK